MAQVSSGLAFLAHLGDTQRALMFEMLRASDNPDQALVRDEKRIGYLFEQIRQSGYSFGLDLGRERSVAVPLMLNGRVRGALLLVFMARVLSSEAVVATYIPKLKALAKQIEDIVTEQEKNAAPAA